MVATVVAFTREALERSHVEALVPLVRTFKVATNGLVAAGRMFRAEAEQRAAASPPRR